MHHTKPPSLVQVELLLYFLELDICISVKLEKVHIVFHSNAIAKTTNMIQLLWKRTPIAGNYCEKHPNDYAFCTLTVLTSHHRVCTSHHTFSLYTTNHLPKDLVRFGYLHTGRWFVTMRQKCTDFTCSDSFHCVHSTNTVSRLRQHP